MIYKGFKVLGYSRALGTALSNSEIAEWYQDRQDPAVTVKLRLQTPDYRLQKIRKKYQVTDDGFNECIVGLIKDEQWRYAMLYHKKEWLWFFPGGKQDNGESAVDALHREIKEEVGVEVANETLIGHVKIIHLWKPWRVHYYEIDITGEPTVLEHDRHGELKWVSTVESDNDLGFAIKIDDIIIDDVKQIQRDFVDYALLEQWVFSIEAIDTAPMHMLAWTTTPWTLPSNMFVAVNKNVVYSIVFDKNEKEYYVMAESLLSKYYKDKEDYIFICRLMWSEMVGLEYWPLFDYYYQSKEIDPIYHSQVHKVLHADFVTEDAGTGIAHEAPAFGEDDYNLVTSIFPKDDPKSWLFNPVDDHGAFTDEVPDFAGMNVIEANKEVIKNIKDRGLLAKQETINHSYPHCPRTKTPLIYRALESRFLKEQQLTEKTLPFAETITFTPESVKTRFTNWLASAPDRNISRTRFRWAPLPVWECEKEWCEERRVFGSIAEIEEASGQEVKDLHRPYIDEITVWCSCGGEMRRIPEVLDCRFESGSMPYGQVHYMKNKNTENRLQNTEKNTSEVWSLESEVSFNETADFIAEWLDQTRGWFRSLHVLWAAYMDNIVYKNILVTGMILAEDGKKMSKSLKNYPDPRHLLERYGADAFRLYVLGSPVVRGEPLRFSEQWVEQVLKDFIIPMKNVWNFFKTYAEVDQWKDSGTEVYFMRHAKKDAEDNVEDPNVGLSDEGKQQLESKDFIEQVIRVNADVIYVSPSVRAVETAEWVKKVLKDYVNKEIEIIERWESIDLI